MKTRATTHEQENITTVHAPQANEIAVYAGDEQERTYTISELVSLKESGIRGGDMAQRAINEKNVENLLHVDEQALPPVTLMHTSVGDVLLDGYHRREKATREGRTTIRGIARTFATTREAIAFAFKANHAHGQPNTPSERTLYAVWLLDEASMHHEELSVRKASKEAGVSHVAVGNFLERRRQALASEYASELQAIKEETSEQDGDAGGDEHESKTQQDAAKIDAIRQTAIKSLRLYVSHLQELEREDALDVIQQDFKSVPDMENVLTFFSGLLLEARNKRATRERKQQEQAQKDIKRVAQQTGKASKPTSKAGKVKASKAGTSLSVPAPAPLSYVQTTVEQQIEDATHEQEQTGNGDARSSLNEGYEHDRSTFVNEYTA